MSTDMEPKTVRGIKMVLIASLALNLLILGAVAGVMMRKDKPLARDGSPAGMSSFGMPYLRALSKEDRRQISEDLRAKGFDRRAARSDRRAHYEQVLTALRAKPFAAEALENALAQQRAAATSTLETSQAAWMAHVTKMSQEDRAAYADRLQQVLERGKGSKR